MNFFDLPNKPIQRKRQRTSTVALEREEIPFVEFTDEELYTAKGGILAFDVECYINYWEVGFRCYYTDKIVYFERTSAQELNIPKLLWVIHSFCIVGFNSNNYDIIIIWLALTGASTEVLKHATDFIIKEKMRASDIERMYNFKMGSVNHIDLYEVAPGKGSLKAYASRLNAHRLQELPYPPNKILTTEEQKEIRLYNFADLEDTLLLLRKLSPQLELRTSMSAEYGLDLRSKSDAQIAETVICSEVKKITGVYPKRPKIEPGTSFKYKVPEFVKYQTPLLQRMLEIVRNSDFIIKEDGKVQQPLEFEKLKCLQIGNTIYNMGIGGLHSTEEAMCYIASDKILIRDIDATSFYPAAIRGQGLYPKHIGPVFLPVYGTIVDQRIAAKELVKLLKYDKDKTFELNKATTEMNSKKTVILSSFGKFGSKWSNLYAPDLMVQVTVSGQLCILMVIEAIELAGIPVVSGNTDGIVVICPKNRYGDLKNIIKWWEKVANFQTEETEYSAIYSANVNNYLALQTDGKIKAKGWYGNEGLSKNPVNKICTEAVINLILNNTPIEETVNGCKDITKFSTCRNVRGVGEYQGFYLGKVVRFYISKTPGSINYISTGNKVADSEGAKPLMDLPSEFPNDINYKWYIEKAVAILYKIGYLKTEKQQKFF
jgi:DNA polymerase elongation subunit (family B)